MPSHRVAAVPSGAATALRALSSDVAAAGEEKLARVVATIDALPDRGQADLLIDRLRPRLEHLRPPRPLRFTRLLFLPLDPVLVAASLWRLGTIGVPRTAIPSLTRLIRTQLGAEVTVLEEAMIGHTVAETGLVRGMGGALWPRAASVLRSAALPRDWRQQTGLRDTEFSPLCRIVAAALALAEFLCPAAGSSCTADAVAQARALARAMLEQPAAGSAETLATVLVLALEATRQPAALMDALEAEAKGKTEPAVQQARMQAFSFVADRLAAPLPRAAGLDDATAQAEWRAASITQLAAWAHSHPSRRAELEHARRQADAACRGCFSAFMASDLTPPEIPHGSDRGADRAVLALEQTARGLRRFAQAGRRLGGADFYDAALRGAAEQLAGAPGEALDRIDRARLTELLLGPNAAAAQLVDGG